MQSIKSLPRAAAEATAFIVAPRNLSNATLWFSKHVLPWGQTLRSRLDPKVPLSAIDACVAGNSRDDGRDSALDGDGAGHAGAIGKAVHPAVVVGIELAGP